MAEQRPCAAMVREGVVELTTDTKIAIPTVTQRGHRDFNKNDICCHNCSGLSYLQRQWPSSQKNKAPALTASHKNLEPTVLHFKVQGQEISICVLVHELDMCSVLHSGTLRSMLPLHHYIAVHPLPIQPTVETLLGVRPGDMPVLGVCVLLT